MKQTINDVLKSRATWFFAVIWIASIIYLLLTGNGVIGSSAFALGILIFSAITIALTQDQPESQPSEQKKPVLVWAQLLVVLFFVLLTGYRGYIFNMMPGRIAQIPVWPWFAGWFEILG